MLKSHQKPCKNCFQNNTLIVDVSGGCNVCICCGATSGIVFGDDVGLSSYVKADESKSSSCTETHVTENILESTSLSENRPIMRTGGRINLSHIQNGVENRFFRTAVQESVVFKMIRDLGAMLDASSMVINEARRLYKMHSKLHDLRTRESVLAALVIVCMRGQNLYVNIKSASQKLNCSDLGAMVIKVSTVLDRSQRSDPSHAIPYYTSFVGLPGSFSKVIKNTFIETRRKYPKVGTDTVMAIVLFRVHEQNLARSCFGSRVKLQDIVDATNTSMASVHTHLPRIQVNIVNK
jgi:hypothetical protein